MAITVWRSTRSIGRPIPRSDTSDSVATSSESFTGSFATSRSVVIDCREQDLGPPGGAGVLPWYVRWHWYKFALMADFNEEVVHGADCWCRDCDNKRLADQVAREAQQVEREPVAA